MDRVKREDVEKTIDPQYSHGTGRNSAQVRVDDLAAHQTLLLLEIRDLLAESLPKLEHPMLSVRTRPRRHGPRTVVLIGDKSVRCARCAREINLGHVLHDRWLGQIGPMLEFDCPRCRQRLQFDGRNFPMDTDHGRELRMKMRLQHPDEPEEGSGKIAEEDRATWPEPVFCDRPLTDTGQIRCKGPKGHRWPCWWVGQGPRKAFWMKAVT